MGFLLGAATVHGQEPPCGIHSITETIAPIYPPIAKAAHVSGDVMLLITLEHDGSVSHAQMIRGPEMLKESAVTFVKGWKANEYGGSRACPVTIRYELGYSSCAVQESDHPLPAGEQSKRIDSQHYVVAAQGMTICDPGAVLGKRRRFLGIF
jgi:TonB family protein